MEDKPRFYQLLGSLFKTNFLFSYPLISALPQVNYDFVFTMLKTPSKNWKDNNIPPSYISPTKDQNGQSALLFYRFSDHCVFHYSEGIDFSIFPFEISVSIRNETLIPLAEAYFLSMIISFWLEIHQTSVLHASALKADDKALAFLGPSGGGKSTLAAYLMASGFSLVSDDLLAIRGHNSPFSVLPSFPSIRLWPPDSEILTEYTVSINKVAPRFEKQRLNLNPNIFCQQPQILQRIYLLDRRTQEAGSTSIQISSIHHRNALIELLRFSFIGRLSAAADLSKQRLAFFTKLAREVPIKRLSYPSGYEFLPEVRDRILEDCRKD